MKVRAMVLSSFTSAAKPWEQRRTRLANRASAARSTLPESAIAQGCIKLLDFSLCSIGWRRGLGRGGAFLLVSPLLGPLPTRSSRGEDGELDAALYEYRRLDKRPWIDRIKAVTRVECL